MKHLVLFAAVSLLASADCTTAQTRQPLRPSQDLVAVDMYQLIEGLKAESAEGQRVVDATRAYEHAKRIGVASDLPPPLLLFIELSAARDFVSSKSLFEKMDEFDQGLAAYSLHDYRLSQDIWRRLASTGNVEAEIDTGLMYAVGQHGAVLDDGQAFKWYLAAATAGNEVAQENLAILYEEGRGVKSNPILAYVWLTMAAEREVSQGRSERSAALISQRDKMAERLEASEIDQALHIAGRCLASTYRECN